MQAPFESKEIRAYTFLTSLVICGLAGSLITAQKVVHLGVNFPFSNVVFSIFTYPIVDCICELFGKPAARLALWFALISQILLALIIQLSIIAPHSPFWPLQTEYQTILATGIKVVFASVIAFSVSQLLDITIYQRIKYFSKGKKLWLRSNISTYLGQIIDSSIFVLLVFSNSPQKWTILFGSIFVKIILSFLMTPFIYLIVMTTHRYLNSNTLAFKDEKDAVFNFS